MRLKLFLGSNSHALCNSVISDAVTANSLGKFPKEVGTHGEIILLGVERNMVAIRCRFGMPVIEHPVQS